MKWSNNLAYSVGLITTDGCLSNDGRHIDLTSKDLEQLENFKLALGINNKIGTKSDGKGRRYTRIQFSNVKLYRFLLSIGLHPNKSKTLKEILVPDKYFFDFLRGHLDGDGTVYYFWDKRWKSSLMFYIRFYSASLPHLKWLENKIIQLSGATGSIHYKGKSTYELSYAKKSSLLLINKMYTNNSEIYLKRKKFKINEILGIIEGLN